MSDRPPPSNVNRERPAKRSNTNVALIVGGLVVAVLVLAFVMFGGSDGSVDGVNGTVQGGQGTIEGTTDGTGATPGVTDDGAATTLDDPAVDQPADPAGTQPVGD